MAIHDSNPERRNLTALSLSIIIYYLAGGRVADDAVRLQVVNVSFTKPEVLAAAVWALLLWFLYRYWLVNQGGWRKGFHEEILRGDPCRFIYYKHAAKKYGLDDDYSLSIHKDKHHVVIEPQGSRLVYLHVRRQSPDGGGQVRDVREIETLGDRVHLAFCAAYLFLIRPSLSTYFVPYLLFVTAVALGVANVAGNM